MRLAGELSDYLSQDGHAIDPAPDGATALELIKSFEYELIIIDVELPDMSGLSICDCFRRSGGATPILMLTGRSSIEDKETGLDSGADDYLTKPFNARELSARIRALLRRPAAVSANLIEIGDLVIDIATKTVTCQGQPVRLLPKEFAILVFLLRNRNQVFNADMLLERVWPMEVESSPEAVRQCVKRLREKIDIKGRPSVITTVKGFGYTIQDIP